MCKKCNFKTTDKTKLIKKNKNLYLRYKEKNQNGNKFRN